MKSVQPVVNVQVINEVCVNLLRRKVVSEDQLLALIASFFTNYRVLTTTETSLLEASRLRKKYSLSFWDSLIVAAALLNATDVLYSEDMQQELLIESKLRIVNPFIG